MENLPKNVINKIMLYLSHPVADIISETRIFKFMEQRHNDERWYNPQRYYEGCPAHCGYIDACIQTRPYVAFDPRKYAKLSNNRIRYHRDIEEEEYEEYEIAFLHSVKSYIVRRLNLVVFLRIKARALLYEPHDTMGFVSDTESDTESDSDSELSYH